jgi:hypothetical protein
MVSHELHNTPNTSNIKSGGRAALRSTTQYHVNIAAHNHNLHAQHDCHTPRGEGGISTIINSGSTHLTKLSSAANARESNACTVNLPIPPVQWEIIVTVVVAFTRCRTRNVSHIFPF